MGMPRLHFRPPAFFFEVAIPDYCSVIKGGVNIGVKPGIGWSNSVMVGAGGGGEEGARLAGCFPARQDRQYAGGVCG
ncbi:hypothetical protein EBAPG3_007535 [Nitrosospira lacus]|uniref:Uncharacterized protein n=1 Tax=Nitrosospira lacus TaxID=1288494 RepID=A0A1W6SPB6_9PROT|nr:hypothetical protein EBAPG3_007535 [Nitrosospira lacus]